MRTRADAAASARTVAFVLGTRPEIVKLAPLVRRFGAQARVLHTGQHYDHEMSAAFFEACGLRAPDVMLGTGGLPRARQIGSALGLLDEVFDDERPAAVVVQGDTNSALAGALAANAREVPLVHVEAGLRSHDRRMPEEHNRILIDHLSDVLCAPTAGNLANLIAEGIPADRCHVTGNTVVEALVAALPAPDRRAKILTDFGVEPGRFVLATIHRLENADDPDSLRLIVGHLAELAALGWPVVFPVHPRVRDALAALGPGVLGPRALGSGVPGPRVVEPEAMGLVRWALGPWRPASSGAIPSATRSSCPSPRTAP
ncbi:hypothetical protein GCM10009839_32420 [Catenulispora yoronensis]|uniref:UDP-N-acetylglucosamine 2-epimerase domain-containing protein n=2 Tax=Catenulispora yoronensis TaxID=450799 RepID=A0ABP5FMU2_9ACTN